MATVIIGAGIIGTSTAYYLSNLKPATEIHLVEASPQLFASASGFAAGFVARDWFQPSLAQLGALSFDLHQQLAEENNGYERWGYSKSTGISLVETVGKCGADWLLDNVSRATAAEAASLLNGNGPAWLKDRNSLDALSDGSSTSQVDPLPLCKFLMSKCQSRGVRVHQPAKAVKICRDSSGNLSSVTIIDTATQEETTLACTRLVLTAGAWTPEVFRTLFPNSKIRIPITSLAGHSLVVRSPHWPPPKLDKLMEPSPNTPEDCHAVFTTDTEAGYSPEIFSRMPDGHIYLAGLNSSTYPLPKIANQRVIDLDSIATLTKTAHKLLGDDIEVIRRGVCWRPITRSGVPIIADLTQKGEQGVIVCAGHGPWGISNAPGSGMVVAGMIEGKDMSKYMGHLGF